MATANSVPPVDPVQPEARRPRISFYVVLAAALFAFVHTFRLLSPILLSFLLIVLVTLAVNPLISRIRRIGGGRKLPTALILVGMVVVAALTGWASFGPIKSSVGTLSKQLPAYWERLQKPLIRMEQKAERSEEKLQAEVTTEIAEEDAAAGEPVAAPRPPEPAAPAPGAESGSLRSSLRDMLKGVIGRFTAVVFNAAEILIVLVTVVIGATFMLMNPRPIFRGMFALVPERHHGRALAIMRRVGEFVPGWAGAMLLGMLTIGLLSFLLMWPIFGFTDALVLGLIAGLLEAIPFLGPLLSAVLALLLATGQGGMAPLWVVLAYAGIQAVENNVVLPLIMARGMKLHPVAVLFSMLLCVAAFGVLGVLVAAPLVAIVIVIHDELYRKRFLPTVTDVGLDRLARKALHETVSDDA